MGDVLPRPKRKDERQMPENLFLEDEQGLPTIAMPCRGCEECRTYFCIDGANAPIATSYTPMQIFDDIYAPEKGYTRGTIFAALDKPFLAGGM